MPRRVKFHLSSFRANRVSTPAEELGQKLYMILTTPLDFVSMIVESKKSRETSSMVWLCCKFSGLFMVHCFNT